jgi:hypothetical protein
MVTDSDSTIVVQGMAAKNLTVLKQALLQPLADLNPRGVFGEGAEFRDPGINAREVFCSRPGCDNILDKGGDLFDQTTTTGMDDSTISRNFPQLQQRLVHRALVKAHVRLSKQTGNKEGRLPLPTNAPL